MICPACKDVLIVVEYDKIELDQCTQCHGVWFDSGELELLFKSFGLDGGDLFAGKLMTGEETKTSEEKRKCPICGHKMLKKAIAEEPEVIVDVCQYGHGLWFDGGEVAHVMKQLAAKPSEKQDAPQWVVNFLGEVFKF